MDCQATMEEIGIFPVNGGYSVLAAQLLPIPLLPFLFYLLSSRFICKKGIFFSSLCLVPCVQEGGKRESMVVITCLKALKLVN